LADITRRNILSVKHIQFLMFICIIQYMFTIQFNVFDILSFYTKQETMVVPQNLKARPEVPSIDEIFINQIEQSESLYNPIIYKAANEHEVELAMIRAIIMAESCYNNTKVSRKGAKGLMQLMPRTARALGVKDIFNPEENIYAGVRYYKSLLERFDGDVNLALAAYNAGAKNVRKHNGMPPFKETQQYVMKVLAYQNFYKYGPVPELKDIQSDSQPDATSL
jgi:soluble lytic murein transglycosylase-like protein